MVTETYPGQLDLPADPWGWLYFIDILLRFRSQYIAYSFQVSAYQLQLLACRDKG